jgi:hypothetical protein
MTYTYACFISYKRPPKRLYPGGVVPPKAEKRIWLQLAEAFQKKLDAYNPSPHPSFRDEILETGRNYSRDISRSLCGSMVMIALIVPEYFESNWCLAEWQAMEDFEQGRGESNLIIPIICDGNPEELEQHIGKRKYFDMRNVIGPARQLDNVQNRKIISQIAARIRELEKRLSKPHVDCSEYQLAVGPEALTPKVPEPSPFGH